MWATSSYESIVANLDGAYFQGRDLTGITYANCIGTPIGTPAFGTLPVYTAC